MYPVTAPELALPELDGKTAKMYRGGKICLTDHFKPLWARNVPKFGIAHALALGVSIKTNTVLKLLNMYLAKLLALNGKHSCSKVHRYYLSCSHSTSLLLRISYRCITFLFQLGPWLAVEVPDLIEKGVIHYKEKEGEKS